MLKELRQLDRRRQREPRSSPVFDELSDEIGDTTRRIRDTVREIDSDQA
jgi:hypothetical protein